MPSANKELIFAVFVVSATLLIFAVLIILLIYNYFKVKNRKHKEILKIVFETQESERNRISEELHDGIGGKLSALKVQNEVFLSEDTGEAGEAFGKKNAKLIDSVVTDIRRIVRNQSSRFILANGIHQELVALANLYMGLRNDIRIDVVKDEQPMPLAPDFQVTLFRVIQELLHNTIKHSGANEVKIEIHPGKEKLQVVYTDNGKGFDDKLTEGGMGLHNIRTRVELYNGQFGFSSFPNKETKYEFIFRNFDICEKMKSHIKINKDSTLNR